MDNWDEIRTALYVAREGTVSRAAEALGIHHATVIRHIDSLEGRLQAKLFQRHARGYTPTEAGLELLRVGQATDDQFAQLEAIIRGKSDAVEGELVITSLSKLTPTLLPLLAEFQQMHPKVSLKYLAHDRLFRLEYGEAHLAIRAASSPPEDPDNVVQYVCETRVGLYAAQSSVARCGLPDSIEDLAGHRFIANAEGGARAPYYKWLSQAVAPEQIVFRTDEFHVAEAAVRAGMGLGFLTEGADAEDDRLVEVAAGRAEWNAKLFLVTHMDLHRTAKVQAITRFLKERMGDAV